MKLWQAALVSTCILSVIGVFIGFITLIAHLSETHSQWWGIGATIGLIFTVLTLCIWGCSNDSVNWGD